MTQISITVSETAHWHALISKAEFHAHQLLPPGVENYLVSLFIRYEQEEESTFSVNLQKEAYTNPEYKLQRLGDQCLLLCGFYPEASDEYGIALDEFILMGSEAYQKLAKINGINAIVFEYLAGNFRQVSDLLCYISNVTSTASETQKKIEMQDDIDVFAIDTGHIEHLPFSSSISNRILN